MDPFHFARRPSTLHSFSVIPDERAASAHWKYDFPPRGDTKYRFIDDDKPAAVSERPRCVYRRLLLHIETSLSRRSLTLRELSEFNLIQV